MLNFYSPEISEQSLVAHVLLPDSLISVRQSFELSKAAATLAASTRLAYFQSMV